MSLQVEEQLQIDQKEQAEAAASEFAASLKSRDTEEKIDIWFYRPIGLRIAKVCAKLKITPNTVTITSIYIGVVAGILFYWDNIWINIVGMLLLIFANSLDSADGQLARLTNNKSRFGRILDGIAGDFWFGAIAIALSLRLMHAGWSPWVWVLAVVSGLSHVIQSAMADYYRNLYLFFLKGDTGSEFDNSKDVEKQINEFTGIKRFAMKTYHNYTKIQESTSPWLQKFLIKLRTDPGFMTPELRAGFLKANRPLMKYTNIIQFNTRVIFLFIWLFMDQPWLYFVFDILILNPIMLYLINRQESYSKKALSPARAS
ncbi:CDP-alcohol phosphatidyltransferase [Arachidicoccus rhizosphaerae]|uniref:CDP-alcohol phosphatidyltransferase n=1 Tax=Arachidicoccus rhizosphaerae TaxID=551991 RepID=A0A1H4BT73_9BACT|nr:CDP-alcohol phosphatidyltransferase family protein [Arachidicoccus rhizosphaerae]SEA51308.1 CDP-alcohol phosphatidyltransferase [Arachidicoccus rhizosphaerae]